MADVVTRIRLAEAEQLARELVGHLHDACEQIALAGSIRRKRPSIGDIELVLSPKRPDEADLFGNVVPGQRDLLAERIATLWARGILTPRDNTWGERQIKAWYKGRPVELWIVRPPAQWGVILAIRTGPAEFGRRLVVAVPWGHWVRDGRVLRESMGRDVTVPTPDEMTLFRLCGLGWIRPEDRDCFEDWPRQRRRA